MGMLLIVIFILFASSLFTLGNVPRASKTVQRYYKQKGLDELSNPIQLLSKRIHLFSRKQRFSVQLHPTLSTSLWNYGMMNDEL